MVRPYRGFLKTLKGLIVELNGRGESYGYSDIELLSSILRAGFAAYRYEPFRRSLEVSVGFNSERGNTLFLRDPEFFMERVRTAQSIDIRGTAL